MDKTRAKKIVRKFNRKLRRGAVLLCEIFGGDIRFATFRDDSAWFHVERTGGISLRRTMKGEYTTIERIYIVRMDSKPKLIYEDKDAV